MTALKKPLGISIDEYLRGEEVSSIKHEYLGGTVHAMAGASIRHNNIALNFLAFLHAKLRGQSCRPYNSDTKVRIEFSDHTRFYYPDAMVVCQSNPETDHFQTQPVVIAEVLSPSTRRADLGEKRDAYLAIPSLKALLLVESDSMAVTVYRRMVEGGFEKEHYDAKELVILLPEIGSELAMEELYENVDFSEVERESEGA